MIIRRISLKLPASMRGTAEHDARAIAEALATGLTQRGAASKISLAMPAQGRSGPVLGAALAGQIRHGDSHGR